MAEETTTTAAPQQTGAPSAPARSRRPARRGPGGEGGGPRGRSERGPKRASRRPERPRSEFDQKIVGIRRVTRVVAGGRRFSFSVILVIGDRKGRVGVGVGKASDTALAIEKAARAARKALVTVPMTDDKSIPHEVSSKYCASEIEIRPAPGRGLIAGSAVRTVLELAGITNVSAKIFSRSKNHINNARAAVLALQQLRA